MEEPDEMLNMERVEHAAREADAAARERQGLDEDEAARDEQPGSNPELDAAWEKEKERVEQERQQES